MKWSSDKPQVPGWYWWRKRKDNGEWYARVIEVEQHGKDLWWSGIRPVILLDGDWAGPLDPPTDDLEKRRSTNKELRRSKLE